MGFGAGEVQPTTKPRSEALRISFSFMPRDFVNKSNKSNRLVGLAIWIWEDLDFIIRKSRYTFWLDNGHKAQA